MNLDKGNEWLNLLANIGVIAGLVFVAIEVRTNTATNEIAIYQASSSNWMQINGDLMNRDVAVLLEKAFTDDELDNIELRQFEGWVRQQLTHASFVRRLHEAELISDAEFAKDIRGIRIYRKSERFRTRIEAMDGEADFRRLILDDDGLDWWLRGVG